MKQVLENSEDPYRKRIGSAPIRQQRSLSHGDAPPTLIANTENPYKEFHAGMRGDQLSQDRGPDILSHSLRETSLESAKEPLLSDGDRADSTEDKPASRNKIPLPYWILLGSLNVIGPFSSDSYVPMMPTIQVDLGTTDQMVALAMQVNWIVSALVGPFVGGISDRHGRKVTACATIGVYIVGQLGSYLAPDIYTLIFFQGLQGAGQSVIVLAGAIVRDLIDDMQERLRIFAFLSTLRPLMILAAPAIGGFLSVFLTWRLLFLCLASWGALTLLLIVLTLKETNVAVVGKKQGEHKHESFKSQFYKMAVHVDFMGLTITAALFMGGVRSMLTNVPFCYCHLYNLNNLGTGIMVGIPSVCGFAASLIAGKMAGAVRKQPKVSGQWAAGGAAAGSALCLLLSAPRLPPPPPFASRRSAPNAVDHYPIEPLTTNH